VKRFWDKVDKSGNCWLWTAGKDKDGYGLIKFNGRQHRAHRVVLLLDGCDIPSGMLVCHTCDNPSCVNPDHLWIGTNDDNMADMHKKSRHVSRPGEKHHNAKITEEDVQKIRSCKTARTTDLAKKFGISESHTSGIRHGNKWKHI